MALFAGVDIGSAFAKAVILGEGGILSFAKAPSGSSYRQAGETALGEALRELGLTSRGLDAIFTTGCGASSLDAHREVNEITCQGRALNHLFADVRTVIDVGGQASRVLRVDTRGNVVDFAISEKCAMGSGRFLQVMSRVLQTDLEHLGPLSAYAKNPVKFGTSCAVFAESEAISRITEGISKEDIIAGVHNAIAAKVQSLIQRIALEPECAITGGGAMNIGLIRSMEERVGRRLSVPPEPQITAALGAALLARGENQ